MIRFGVLGCGRIGQVHAATLHRLKGAEVAAVADAFPETARSLAEDVGADVRDADEIIASADIDAVAICTPTDTHADLIEASAHNGKPVFCEKPIDLDTERVRTCLKVVEDAGIPLMVGFNRRFDPDFAALEAAVREGRAGALEQITITSRDPAPPPIDYIRRSGGIFRDMMIHDFDMARFLLDEPIVRVLATGAVRVNPTIGDAGDFDTATVVMESVSGVQVVISNSRRATYGYDQRVEVFGSNGMLQLANRLENGVTHASADGLAGSVLMDFFMERYSDAYAEEMRAFMACVEGGSPPPVSGIDGLEALHLADAAALSQREARWVNV